MLNRIICILSFSLGALAQTATLYGQCGGAGWTGPTQCPSGAICAAENQYYSQCVTSCPAGWSCTGGASGTSSPTSTTSSIVITATGTAGITTRYWDCCKPSCSWPGKATFSSPVQFCDKSDTPLTDYNTPSACPSGGNGYMCSSQSPWAVNDTLAYGFAAVALSGETESQYCCQCYQLTFTSTAIAGKTMIVQVTNTGGVGGTQFDLAIPGGGVGDFNACTNEWGAPAGGWGQQYGGVSSEAQCAQLPKALQAGCNFRFDWMEGADNPNMIYAPVTCPAEITAKTGCVRD